MNPLQSRLAGLRRRLRFLVTFRGVCALVSVLLLVAVLDGLLDWGLYRAGGDLPAVIRASILVAGLSLAGVIAYRLLIDPLAARADDLTLALRIEERYPALNDSLASTVEFLQQTGDSDRSGSPSLRQEAVQRALRQARGCDFSQILDVRGLRRAGAVFALAIAASVTLVALGRASALTALARLTNPFGGARWPAQTRLHIDYTKQLAAGDTFQVTGSLEGVVPESVVVEYQGLGMPQQTYPVTRGDDPTRGTLSDVKLQTSWNQGDFRFQVRANDALSGWHEVRVLPPPKLTFLEGRSSPQVSLRYPAYTELPSVDLAPGTGQIDAVAGTHAILRAAVDRPIEAAWIDFKPENPLALPALATACLGAQDPLGSFTHWRTAIEVCSPVPADLDGERRVLTIRFIPRLTGEYALHFRDENGLAGSRRFEQHVINDPSPTVSLERPSPSLDPMEVLPGADLNLCVHAEAMFGVRSVFVEYSVHRGREPNPDVTQARRELLYDHRAAGLLPTGLLSALVGVPVPAPLPLVRVRSQKLEAARRWSLAPLGLAPGDVLTIQACADDFDDVSVDKEPGRSHQIEIRVVDRPELEVKILEAQAEVQKELLNLRKLEQEALQKVLEVEQRWRDTGKLRPEDVRQLVEAEQLQQQIRARVGAQEQEGLRARVARALQALRDNHMPQSGDQERMEMVANELRRLADEELDQIEPRLTTARKDQAASPQGRKPAKDEKGPLGEARQHQEEVENTLNELLNRLQALSEVRDMSSEAKALLEEQRKLGERVGDLSQKLMGRDAEALTDEQRAELDQAAALQEKLRDRLNQMLDRMQGAADKKGEEAEKRLQQADEAITKAHQDEHDPELRRLLTEAKRALDEATGRLQQEKLKALQRTGNELREAASQDDPVQARLHREQADRALDQAGKAAEEQQDRLRQAGEQLRKAQEQGSKDADMNKQIEDAARALEEAAERRATADPLERAARVGKTGQAAEQMRQAGQSIKKNNGESARKEQEQASDSLRKMIKQLDDQRQLELDQLSKKLEAAQGRMAELARRQEELRKRVQAAGKIQDPKDRAAELKRLAKEQQELRKEAQDQLRELNRLRASRSAQALSQAASGMERQARRLEQGEMPDEDDQEETLDRLADAQDELDQAKDAVEEELAREKLAKLADVIKRLKERQEALSTERARIDRSVQQKKGWDRGLRASLGQLGDDQKALGDETGNLAKEKLAGAEAFLRTLKKSATAMGKAGERLQELPRDDQDREGLTAAAKLQDAARRRIDQVLDALKPGSGMRSRQARKEQPAKPGGEQGGGGGGGQQPGDGIPQMAQLKLLRALQQDVNERTESFGRSHSDPKKLTEPEKKELQELSQEQQELRDLLEKVTTAGEPEGGKK
jgi:hypothetical protein